MIPNDPRIHRLPTLTKFAVFYGATTISGNIHDAKNKNRHPTQKSAMKYG